MEHRYLTDQELERLAREGFFGPITDWQCPQCGHYTIWRRKSDACPDLQYVLECKCKRCGCGYKEAVYYY